MWAAVIAVIVIHALVSVLFTAAAVRMVSAGASEAERMLEDEDQRKALEEWKDRHAKKKKRS